MNKDLESAYIETEETSIHEVLDQIDDVTNFESSHIEADETSVYEIIDQIDDVTFQNSINDEDNKSVENNVVDDNDSFGDVTQAIDISEASQFGLFSGSSTNEASEGNEDLGIISHNSETDKNESEPESSNKSQSECIKFDPFDIGSSPCVYVHEASDEGMGNDLSADNVNPSVRDSDNCSHHQDMNASVNSDDKDKTVIEIVVEIDSETEQGVTEKLDNQIDDFGHEDQGSQEKSTKDNKTENENAAIVHNNDTDLDETVIYVSDKGTLENEIDRDFDDTADTLHKGNKKADNKTPINHKGSYLNNVNHHMDVFEVDMPIRKVCFGGRDGSDLSRKKRHLSSKADSETTPKRLKNIEAKLQLNSDLSPIEKAFTLLKERGIIEAFGETPVVYSKATDMNDSRESPESSTPRIRNNSHVRKVIWMDDSEKDFVSKLYNASTLVEDSDQEENNDVRKVICKSEKFELFGQNIETEEVLNNEPVDDSVFSKEELEHTRNKIKTNSNNLSHPCTPGQNQDSIDPSYKNESRIYITISDSTYFSEDARRSCIPENTTKSEGRFKNVEATISKIDFLDDEDILLTEDILGLESAYDFDESEIDEDTLLAESDDNSNTSQSESGENNAVRSEEKIKNVETTISKKDIEIDEDILLRKDTLGLEIDYEDKDIDDESFLAGDDIRGDRKCEGKTVVSQTSTANVFAYDSERPCLSSPVDVIVIVESLVKRNVVVKQSEISPEKVKPESTKNKVNIEVEIFQSEEGNDPILYEKCTNDQEDSTKAEEEATLVKQIEIEIELKDKITDNKTASPKKKQTNVPSQKVKSNQEPLLVVNKNNNYCNMKVNSIVSPIDMTFLANDKNNNAMEEVKQRWKCDNIPSPEVNLTLASTFHQNYSKQNDNTQPALLEGEKISCLDFYEGEINTRHQKMNHCSLSQVMNKLRQQKADLDQIKLTALHQLEQECYRKCSFLRSRHREEFDNLRKRQRWQFDELHHSQFIMPCVKQQQIMALGLHHGEEEQRLQQHQKFEFENLSQDLKACFMREAECMKKEVTPVDLLISQVKKMERTKMPSMEKYGPTVMVSLKKRPCKENNWKESNNDVCLPVVIAQALSHEEDVYNHYYKF